MENMPTKFQKVSNNVKVLSIAKLNSLRVTTIYSMISFMNMLNMALIISMPSYLRSSNLPL